MTPLIRLACRSLTRHAGFSAFATVTIAIAIAATTAMFSVVRAVLLRPMPVLDQQQLVTVHEEGREDDALRAFSRADLIALREETHTLASIAGVRYEGAWPFVVKNGDQAL